MTLVVADVNNTAECGEMVNLSLERFGAIHIFVSNTCTHDMSTVDFLDEENFYLNLASKDRCLPPNTLYRRC